jgi:hypothetical protein
LRPCHTDAPLIGWISRIARSSCCCRILAADDTHDRREIDDRPAAIGKAKDFPLSSCGELKHATARTCKDGGALESQFASDSPLEGDGFEISVPQCLATADGGHLHSGLTGSSSPRKQLYPFAETDNHSDDSAALTSNDPNPTEASTPVTILRGTEISNPFPSSGESCKPLVLHQRSAPGCFANRSFRAAVLTVRIHLPPARSQQRTLWQPGASHAGGTQSSNPLCSSGEMVWGRRRGDGTIVAATN